MVGMVVQTGSRVRDFKVGDRVWARTSLFRDGSNADYVLVEEVLITHATLMSCVCLCV
jgi:NADPH:quinone reductase-like Zn-dependent oxidoreductase